MVKKNYAQEQLTESHVSFCQTGTCISAGEYLGLIKMTIFIPLTPTIYL